MIIKYSDNNENRIYWQHRKGEEWRTAELDELIEAYEREKTSKWIPVSERLPKRFGEVLVTFIPSAGTLWTKVIIAHYSDLMGIAQKPCFGIGEVGKESFCDITKQVVAWQPLPKPYKGQANCGERMVEE